jgi:PKD repeat protein
MKGKKSKKKISFLIITILISIPFLTPTTIADEHITVSFDPQPYTPPPSPPPPSPPPPSPKPNQNPIANVTGPLIGYVNETLIFSANYSYDPDGYIIGYRWDFNNDGLFDTDWIEDVIITHYYSSPGNYTVKLQVMDNDSATSMDSYVITIITVEPPLQLPVAEVSGPFEGFTDGNITFNCTGSYDPDGVIVNYTWDFGDGHTSYMKNPIHSYSEPGNYTVILKVTDNDNLTNTYITTVCIRAKKQDPVKKSLPILLIFLISVITMTIIVFMPIIRHYHIGQIVKKKFKVVESMEDKNRHKTVKARVDKSKHKTVKARVDKRMHKAVRAKTDKSTHKTVKAKTDKSTHKTVKTKVDNSTHKTLDEKIDNSPHKK